MCPTGTSLPPATTASEFRQAFDLIDADRDGKISGDDLGRFYSSVATAGAGAGEEMIKSMISVADVDKDGYVQYDEFQRVLEVPKESGGGVMEDIFRAMDRDGDGRLGLEDMRSYLGRAGLSVEEEEIKAMIRLGGGDETGGVSFKGFVNILAVDDLVY